MDLTRQLDLYCERLGPGFWAEPFNAITNGAFILAAIIAYWAAAKRGAADWPIAVLVAITVCVGIGSFLFHTFATVWAVIADVLFIQIFIVFYFVFAMRRFAGLPWWGCALATVAFMSFSFFGEGFVQRFVGEGLRGSEGYIPPLLGLLFVGGVLVIAGRVAAGVSLLAGAILFAVSLTFRTVDLVVCDAFPLGTHFIWHTLNGVLLGFLVIAMARYGVLQKRGAVAAA
ncbi:MAG: ceramidase domain-containing protein [Pseudomonadota bacterium]